jgi:uncharacterized protein involved in exopolysaccharide biosynthesis
MTLRRFLVALLVLVMVAVGAAVWWTGLLTTRYTAKATLVIAALEPTTLSRPGEKVDLEEFAIFRNSQAELIRERFVIQAALRNNKLKNLPSLVREDAKHNSVAWLTDHIHVTFPEGKSGIMEVSATLPDPKEAAAIVNAVVEAYMDVVVNVDREKRHERYDSLSAVAVEKEEEVRRKREQLKRELESIGAGDDQTVSLRGQMAVSIYAEYQRELQTLKFDRNALQGQLEAANSALKVLADASNDNTSELEISGLLYSIPGYRELFTRKMLHGVEKKPPSADSKAQILPDPGKDNKSGKAPPEPGAEHRESGDADIEAEAKILDELHEQCRRMLSDAKRLELEREISRLTARINIATEQIAAFEKEVESKARDADVVGKSSVSAQMQRADLESVERILQQVVDERERLKVELKSPSRVAVVGDKNAPAAVPENPD